MKHYIKRFIKILAVIFGAFILLLFISSITNIILLKIENKKIVPNGTLIEVNNHRLHVYSQGDINNKPTLVFMSGGGTAAPLYDFKPLYSLLYDEYHTIVIEKIGYGYADIVNTNRDIDIMLEETRAALQSAGNNGPYVLFPHSMSGLEALYWLSKYPQEIIAIIGLDMAFPAAYDRLKETEALMRIQYALLIMIAKTGLQRIPIFTSQIAGNIGLTVEEHSQAKYLAYRNFGNISLRNEVKSVFANAEKVHNANITNKNGNILLFSSTGKEIGKFWVSMQKDFASEINVELVLLDCGHYIHHFESAKIAEKSKQFLNELLVETSALYGGNGR
ncbi:MAG: alpha/beta hydrolase [Treponema sp.]|jgi:pimeloyl-ACP methyl ester carboxylesterase|nr:alpha/beta hydrolase [Treponema sp.]